MITLKQLEDEIRLIAYQLYELRGKEPGHEVEDWVEAEKVVLGKYLKNDGGLEDKSAEAKLKRGEEDLTAEAAVATTSAGTATEATAVVAANVMESDQKVERRTGQKKPHSTSGRRSRGRAEKKNAG